MRFGWDFFFFFMMYLWSYFLCIYFHLIVIYSYIYMHNLGIWKHSRRVVGFGWGKTTLSTSVSTMALRRVKPSHNASIARNHGIAIKSVDHIYIYMLLCNCTIMYIIFIFSVRFIFCFLFLFLFYVHPSFNMFIMFDI